MVTFRREALIITGGFDERFPRAFREDADLAYRARQRGNADDALLRRMYGRRWRTMLEVPPGRRHCHALITRAGGAARCAAATAAITPRWGRLAATAGAAAAAG